MAGSRSCPPSNTEVTRLLLITDDSTSAQTLPAALTSSADFQVLPRLRFGDAKGAVAAGAFEAALFLPGRIDSDFFQEITTARAIAPGLAIVVIAPAGTGAETQGRLLTAGADSVLYQPVDVAALASHLTRLTGRVPAAVAGAEPPAAAPRLNAKAAALSSALEVLRDFSQVLGYSLDYRQLTQHFILKLREVVGLSRIAIFLEPGAVDPMPAALAAKVHDVVEKGADVEPFFHETAGATPRLFRASLVPLRQPGARLPQTALLLLEDFTQIRAAQRAEIESSNLKLISLIARRFAHEIRNALVPLTTHAQLYDAEIGQEDFRASLKDALTRETQRIQRFTDQMLLLARSDQSAAELAPLEDILRASFEKSRAYLGGEAELEIKSEVPAVLLRCNRASLMHAFQEIFLNGLQSGAEAGSGPRRLTVTLNAEPVADGRAELIVQVRDSGAGFATEAAPRATEPFFTTRNTGVGLGLTIARRVIEAHAGRLDVHPRTAPTDSDLTIRLPLPR
jgi:signal transduction histidine kinase